MIKHKYEVTLTYKDSEQVEPVWADNEKEAVIIAKENVKDWNPNGELISIKQVI